MAAFDTLNVLNINGHTEQKDVGGKKLTYLSWPWAWAEVKKRYPDAHYTIWRNENGAPYTVDPQTGYMVYTSVTIEGVTHEMWLPVMDGANRAMKTTAYDYTVKNPYFKYAKWDEARKGYYDKYDNLQTEYVTKHCEAATMMDINKTIMRCLVKNLAMFGLGLYIYAGEDLPEAEKEEAQNNVPTAPAAQIVPAPAQATVTTEQTVPQTKAPDPNPQEGELPGAFIKRRISEISQAVPGFNFMNARAALIKNGLVEDIPSATMNIDQARKLMDAILVNVRAS